MNKKGILKEFITVFWLFIIGSLIGYILEMIVGLVQTGHFESRQGLVYGPFTPVYGIGIIMYYFILKSIKTENKTKIFFLTAILGGILEYMCSFLQEKIYGTISWDYSHLIFNINGRTSILHCTYWGIAGILYVMYVAPLLEKMKEKINARSFKAITTIVLVFMLSNICISCVAASRQTERRKNIAPTSNLDVFLDKYYSDEYMDRIYANKKEV